MGYRLAFPQKVLLLTWSYLQTKTDQDNPEYAELKLVLTI